MHILLLAGIALLVLVYFRSVRRRRRSSIYDRLLRMTLGDRAKAERLIAYEAQRDPDADRDARARDAIDRWRQDDH